MRSIAPVGGGVLQAPWLDAGVAQPSSPSDAAERRRERFEQRVLPHLDAAFNLARWLVGNESDASDIVQDSCLRAFRFFDGYHGGDSRAWLLAIVRNTCRSWLRRHKMTAPTATLDEALEHADSGEPTPEDRVIEASRLKAVRQCIDALVPEYREALILRELEGLTYRQIAEVTGVPMGTVMSRLSRARKQLEHLVRPVGRASG